MTWYVAREIDNERAADARNRSLVELARRMRRARRRAGHEPVGRRWLRRPGVRNSVPAPLTAAPAPVPEDVTVVLARLLDGVAYRIVESGTEAERSALDAVADVSRRTAPGAAAALVDWSGAEIVRLRAFGVLHGVVMGVLGPEDQVWLLDRLRGTGRPGQGDLVA